jgi:hypothetical protein
MYAYVGLLFNTAMNICIVVFVAQEVVSLLRDKLQACGSDLVDARNRVAELEANQLTEGMSLKTSASQLFECGSWEITNFVVGFQVLILLNDR